MMNSALGIPLVTMVPIIAPSERFSNVNQRHQVAANDHLNHPDKKSKKIRRDPDLNPQ